MSTENPHPDRDSLPTSPRDVRRGSRQPTVGDHSRHRAKFLAQELVLMVRATPDLAIVVEEGDHRTQYRRVISPKGRRRWVRIASGDAPIGLGGETATPDRATAVGDDVVSVWVDTLSKQRVIEELFDALATRGHPIRDGLPEYDANGQDTPTPTVEVCPVKDAPELLVSPQRAFTPY